ncbi:hypothetical protein ANCCAN_02697 [Ancylostoma caninum]|uniref:Cystatin domain-containing protein n=1 Tax=Ancylostoma caninum TaxID=29170 RepID=A0A368H3E7_ANCCA|nr:hypothetical protein ANCCAN_02697 [Ancylostoma caninum]
MIRFILLFTLIAVVLAFIPGTGEDLGVMTIHFDIPYTALDREHYEDLVKKALINIATHQYQRQYNGEYARINGRSVNDKLVVDVQAMNINCEHENTFLRKFICEIGYYHIDTKCPANTIE